MQVKPLPFVVRSTRFVSKPLPLVINRPVCVGFLSVRFCSHHKAFIVFSGYDVCVSPSLPHKLWCNSDVCLCPRITHSEISPASRDVKSSSQSFIQACALVIIALILLSDDSNSEKIEQCENVRADIHAYLSFMQREIGTKGHGGGTFANANIQLEREWRTVAIKKS